MEDILPHYLAIGVTKAEFMRSCPVQLEPYDAAHRRRLEEQNTIIYLQGRYVAEAIMSTIGNSPWFKGKGAPAHEYPKEPYPVFVNEAKHMSKDEKQREVDKFFAQESVRRANWRRIHKGGMGS